MRKVQATLPELALLAGTRAARFVSPGSLTGWGLPCPIGFFGNN